MVMSETEKVEGFVRRLVIGLYTVWNQNPSAFRWWSGLVYSHHFNRSRNGSPQTKAKTPQIPAQMEIRFQLNPSKNQNEMAAPRTAPNKA